MEDGGQRNRKIAAKDAFGKEMDRKGILENAMNGMHVVLAFISLLEVLQLVAGQRGDG